MLLRTLTTTNIKFDRSKVTKYVIINIHYMIFVLENALFVHLLGYMCLS